jgi:hypothetical protein
MYVMILQLVTHLLTLLPGQPGLQAEDGMPGPGFRMSYTMVRIPHKPDVFSAKN